MVKERERERERERTKRKREKQRRKTPSNSRSSPKRVVRFARVCQILVLPLRSASNNTDCFNFLALPPRQRVVHIDGGELNGQNSEISICNRLEFTRFQPVTIKLQTVRSASAFFTCTKIIRFHETLSPVELTCVYCKKKKKKKKEKKKQSRSTSNSNRRSRSRRFELARSCARVRSTIRDNYGTMTLCSLEGVEKVQKPGINVKKPGRLVTSRRRRSPVLAGSRRSNLETESFQERSVSIGRTRRTRGSFLSFSM